MKKVIELLKQSRQELVTGPGGIFYAEQMRSARRTIDKALAELKTPLWYTPERWEAEAGEPWPDNGAVYVICVGNRREFWYPKSLELVKRAGISLKSVIVATEAGPPPDEWRPE
jgi:hypothetical protein